MKIISSSHYGGAKRGSALYLGRPRFGALKIQGAQVAKRVRVMLCGTVSGMDAAVELTWAVLQRVQKGIIRARVNSQHRQIVIMRTAVLSVMPSLVAVIVALPLPGYASTHRYGSVTTLEDGSHAVSRESTDPFGSGEEVQRVAEKYCTSRSLEYQLLDRKSKYVNRGSDAVHRVTLYFRCVEPGAPSAGGGAAAPANP